MEGISSSPRSKKRLLHEDTETSKPTVEKKSRSPPIKDDQEVAICGLAEASPTEEIDTNAAELERAKIQSQTIGDLISGEEPIALDKDEVRTCMVSTSAGPKVFDTKIAAHERAKRRSQMIDDLISGEEPNAIDKAEVRTYKENANFEEACTGVEPFNLEQEKGEGYFDDNNNFVHNATDKGIKDAWLDSVGGQSNLAHKSFAEKIFDRVKEDGETDLLSSEDVGKIMSHTADLLEPEETVRHAFSGDFAVDAKLGKTGVILRNANAIIVAAECYAVDKELSDVEYDRFKIFESRLVCHRTSSIADATINDYYNNTFLKMSKKKRAELTVKEIATVLGDLIEVKRKEEGLAGPIYIGVAGINTDAKKNGKSLDAWVSHSGRLFDVEEYRGVGTHGFHAISMLANIYDDLGKDTISEEQLIDLGLKSIFSTSAQEKYCGDAVQVYVITTQGIRQIRRSLESLVKMYDTFEQQESMGRNTEHYDHGNITKLFYRLREERKLK